MQTASSIVLPALLTAALLFGSCGLVEHKNPEEKSKADSTFFNASLNGKKAWNGKGRAIMARSAGYNWLTIVGQMLIEEQYPIESLELAVAFRGPGNYSLMNVKHNDVPELTSGASFYELDGDVTTSAYHATDDTSANQLTITSYDSTTGIVKGTFRTTLVVDSADRVEEPGEPPRRRPDTLRFTDGEFRVKVEDRRDE